MIKLYAKITAMEAVILHITKSALFKLIAHEHEISKMCITTVMHHIVLYTFEAFTVKV